MPRQTISSAIPELVSVTESSLATSPSNSKPEKVLSEAIPSKPILLLNLVPLLVRLDHFASFTRSVANLEGLSQRLKKAIL